MKDRISYLNGLVDGLELAKKSKEGEVIKEITLALEEFAEMLEAMDHDLGAVEQENEYLEERLNLLEKDYYGMTEADYDTGVVEVECPRCNEIVNFEDEILTGENNQEIFCPVCRGYFVFENEPLLHGHEPEIKGEEPEKEDIKEGM